MGAAAATMPGMEIKALTVDEFLSRPEWPALIREYAVESALEPFADTATPQWDAYQALMDQGALVVLGAFDADRLIGFLAVVVTVLPHFGVRMACTESYFVASAARNTGAGLALLREAQAVAQAAEAHGLLVSAPEGSRLARVLAATDYKPSHRVFFKEVSARPATQVPAMAEHDLSAVRKLQEWALAQPQVQIPTHHTLHGGMYARTICLKAGTLIVGALIKVPTLLVLSGDSSVFVGGNERERRYTGHHVIQAQPGRKQVFLAHADTHLTMLFPTSAQTVAEAENEFTDEAQALGSRRPQATNLVALKEG